MQLPEETLGVGGLGRDVGLPLNQGLQACAIEAWRHLRAHPVGDRRQNIDVPHLLLHALPGPDHRAGHDERDTERRIVEKDAMFHLAMLAEALTMVRGHDHERVL